MNHGTAGVAVCALFALTAAPAKARDEEAQFWFTQGFSARMDGATTLTVDVNQRIRSQKAGGDQYLANMVVDRKIAKGIEIGVGIAYSQSDADKEMRFIQQIALTQGRLSLRTRLEERRFDAFAETALRLRQRVQLTQPLDRDKRWTGVLSAEAFFQLNRLKPSDTKGLGQVRTQIGLRRALGKAMSLQLVYLRQQNLREHRPDYVAHAPLMTLNWKL